MEVHLIENPRDYEEGLAEVRRLWRSAPGSRDRRKLEVLAMLLHHYERQREPLPELDPIAAIKFRMEQQGLSRKDLLPIFGTTARIAEILNGRRRLTLEMIRKLHEQLEIPLESLIGRQRSRAAGNRGGTVGARSRRRAA